MQKTLDEWKTVLTKDFLALQHLAGQDANTRMRYALKEQEIGQHCCQAGESLTDTELARLKRVLGLSEQQWQASKSKVRPMEAVGLAGSLEGKTNTSWIRTML